MKNLKLSSRYSREDIHRVFSPDTTFTPQSGTWGLHGIVTVPRRNKDYVFIVTYGQKQGKHEFDEEITENGVLTWQSQPSQNFSNKHIQNFIDHNELINNIYLFLRTKAGVDYQYMGRLKYLNHNPNREKPVYFEWQLLDWGQIEYDASIEVTKVEIVDSEESENTLIKEDYLGSNVTNTSSKRKSFSKRAKPDYSGQEASNRELGLAGELLVLSYERQILLNLEKPELSNRVQHTSVEEGDGAGYDIKSFDIDNNTLFVEVKTTKGSKSTPFYMSSNELEFAKQHKDSYRLYRVYNYNEKTNSGKLFVIKGKDIGDLNFEPTVYRVKV
jgi:hypothetical protein